MGTIQNVLHTSAKPVSTYEFMDAVRATCLPRFAGSRGTMHRKVAIAVSGGVDSMALSYLCSQVRKVDPCFKISDNPVSGFRGLVVDHSLREESREEARAVCAALRDMNHHFKLLIINWSKALGSSVNPKDLPNFESVARRLRYRMLGETCASLKIASMLLGHHEDDQYETVLMRLLQGHGSRGLRGMRKANDIPECDGIFGADKSGFIDDQARTNPFYNMKPPKKERSRSRRHLRRAFMAELAEDDGEGADLAEVDLRGFYAPREELPLSTRPIEVEDGGVAVYRPLLEFSKDRLVATCIENGVPWWEDGTNQNPTLTMRNAIRHLYRGYSLPKALQKPAILTLAKTCEFRAQAKEAEAKRLMRRVIIHDFETSVGTVTVQFPNLRPRLARRDSRSPFRRRARLLKQRELAAIVLRKIIELVSPESHPPLLATLENHVPRVFPSLATPDEAAVAKAPPKPFSLSSVYFTPTPNPSESPSSPATLDGSEQHQISWYLSRAPYPSTRPLPRVRSRYWAVARTRKGHWLASPPMQWGLWDGRYWVRMAHRFPYRVIVLPYLREHAKPFRDQLAPDDRARLAALLRRFAPGKARYTLPAVYLEEDLDLDPHAAAVPRRGYPRPLAAWLPGCTSMHPAVLDTSKVKLLALPTLGMQLPGLDEWMSCEIRYRRADRETLQAAGTFDRGSFAAPRRGSRR